MPLECLSSCALGHPALFVSGGSEVSALLQEINDSKAALAEAHRAVEAREKEMAKMQTMVRHPP